MNRNGSILLFACFAWCWLLMFGFGLLMSWALSPQEARNSTETQRAMAAYRATHGTCEWDRVTTTRLEVHHVIPVHVRPDMAACPTNYVVLCRRCHEVVGHARDFRRRWVPNLREVVEVHGVSREGSDHDGIASATNGLHFSTVTKHTNWWRRCVETNKP